MPSAPIRALRAFSRINVAAGQSRHMQFTLDPRDLSVVNEAGDRIIAPGEYQLSVGGGQPGAGIKTINTHFSITGQKKLPE